MADQHSPDWIGPALAAGGMVFTGILGWLGVRFTARTSAQVAKPDPQAQLNEGFVDLAEQMRLELKAASRERNHLNQVLEEERRSWRVEREAWRIEREAFLGRINQLQAVAEGFERLLRRNGIELPERKSYDPVGDPNHGPAMIVETTLRQDGTDDA